MFFKESPQTFSNPEAFSSSRASRGATKSHDAIAFFLVFHPDDSRFPHFRMRLKDLSTSDVETLEPSTFMTSSSLFINQKKPSESCLTPSCVRKWPCASR